MSAITTKDGTQSISVADPKPLPGTKTGVGYLVRLKGDWTPRQKQARDILIDTLLSDDFTQALMRRGLERPPEFAAGSAKTAAGAHAVLAGGGDAH